MRHDDEHYRLALRSIKTSGQSVDLVLDVLEEAQINMKEYQAIRDAITAAWTRNLAEHAAWVRTPNGPRTSRALHAWVENGLVGGRPAVPSVAAACGIVVPCAAVRVAREHSVRMREVPEDHFFHSCSECKRSLRVLRRASKKLLKLGQLYKLAGVDMGAPA
jgi:hypothetical protein